MKTKDVSAHRRQRRDRQIHEVVHDPYKERFKPAGDAYCAVCGAVFTHGRWAWGARPREGAEHTCPACRRVQDCFPAGYLTLTGEFVVENLDMLKSLIRHEENSARSDHPMERIIQMTVERGELRITTTDLHLPQRLGNSLQSAYQGRLEIQRTPDDYQIRVTWER